MNAKQRFPNLPPDWNSREWRHCILSTYGSWLYGDSRGFRTRHHREHVDGDYKNPPHAGRYAAKERSSRAALKEPPVVLAVKWRTAVGQALVERLTELDAYTLCAAVNGQHIHALIKFPEGASRRHLAKAKRHVWFSLREQGWSGHLWAKRGRAIQVRDKRHHANVFRYICAHAKQGAWVWLHPDVRGR
jgi:hypothetical protein